MKIEVRHRGRGRPWREIQSRASLISHLCRIPMDADAAGSPVYTEFGNRMTHRKWIRGQHWAALASAAQCCSLIHFLWVILLPNSVDEINF